MSNVPQLTAQQLDLQNQLDPIIRDIDAAKQKIIALAQSLPQMPSVMHSGNQAVTKLEESYMWLICSFRDAMLTSCPDGVEQAVGKAQAAGKVVSFPGEKLQ